MEEYIYQLRPFNSEGGSGMFVSLKKKKNIQSLKIWK